MANTVYRNQAIGTAKDLLACLSLQLLIMIMEELC